MMDSRKLRNFRENDFEAFHASVSEYDVVKMTGGWPWPADPAFTRMRMQTPEARAGLVKVIDLGGEYAGQVAVIKGELGYMVAKPHWGLGLASWAAAAQLSTAFSTSQLGHVSACVWHGNPASEAVLFKQNFTKTGTCEDYCKPRKERLMSNTFRLSRADWARTQPLNIKTDRLIIKPFIGNEAAELSALMNDRDVAEMMATIPHPFSEAQAAEWLAERPFCHSMKTGFGAKVALHDGTLIGFCGIGGNPVNTAYAFGRQYWGHGYATEAMQAFLHHATQTFALNEITAGAMFDNPASQRVLEKLGFAKVGEKQHKPSGRLEKATLFLYRLACNDRTAQ